MGWRQETRLRKEQEAAAVEAMKAEGLPWCGEKISGLFWIDGRDGYYTQQITGIKAFDTVKRRVIYLKELVGEALADYLELQDIGANLAWAAVTTCGGCNRIVRDCTCNDYPEF